MAVVCGNPLRDRHEIADGDRRVDIRPLAVNWGDGDLRADWEGNYFFCSFGCLSDWASEKASQHDGRVVVEGTG